MSVVVLTVTVNEHVLFCFILEKMKITNLDWTSVPIKGAGGDFTGLAAFEECSTYQVVSDKSHKKKKVY